MSGPEVFERLRDIRPAVPVVLMSGYHEDEIATRVGEGISGFVQKPFTPADLASRMRRALEPEEPSEPTSSEPAPAGPAGAAASRPTGRAAREPSSATSAVESSETTAARGRDGI